MPKMKDSKDRTNYDTGAVRDGEVGKGRYDLISPIAMHMLAAWSEAGAIKYDVRNWEKGIPASSFVDSLIRHLDKVMCGLTDEDHLAAILWNAQGLAHTLKLVELGIYPEELDDLPKYFEDEQEVGLEFFEPDVWIQDMAAEKKFNIHDQYDADGKLQAGFGLAECANSEDSVDSGIDVQEGFESAESVDREGLVEQESGAEINISSPELKYLVALCRNIPTKGLKKENQGWIDGLAERLEGMAEDLDNKNNNRGNNE